MPESRTIEVLSELLSQPTAPFYEDRVRSYIERAAARLRLQARRDRYGNVLVEYRRGRGRQMIAFTAHMDHPGLEVVAGGQKDCLALWHGAVPPHPLAGARVAIHHGLDGPTVKGTIVGPVERSDVKNARPFPIATSGSVEPGAFGHFDLVPFRMGSGKSADLAFTKGADDLGGCAAILLLFERLCAEKPTAHVIGLFTRAEEVGFYGTLGLLSEKALPKKAWIVVLETSKTLPGAEIGRGPVVRVGDRARVFDPDLLHAMKKVAEDRRVGSPGFCYQMRVMDGGTCEATPWVLAGYHAAGIAFPLGNYHNIGETKVEPEYISITDVERGLGLMWDLSMRVQEFPEMVRTQKAAIIADLRLKLDRLKAAPRRG